MKKTLGLVLALAALCSASNPPPAAACHRCGRHGGRPVRVAARAPVACYPPASMAAAPAQPQIYAVAASAQAQVAPAPAPVAAAPAAPAVPAPAMAGLEPTYNYQASPEGAPAYYYTYDKDDRLIPVQWMDWLFRGGRAAGEPRPPLPIIGRLQGR